MNGFLPFLSPSRGEVSARACARLTRADSAAEVDTGHDIEGNRPAVRPDLTGEQIRQALSEQGERDPRQLVVEFAESAGAARLHPLHVELTQLASFHFRRDGGLDVVQRSAVS
jgi:hypothetical protein